MNFLFCISYPNEDNIDSMRQLIHYFLSKLQQDQILG